VSGKKLVKLLYITRPLEIKVCIPVRFKFSRRWVERWAFWDIAPCATLKRWSTSTAIHGVISQKCIKSTSLFTRFLLTQPQSPDSCAEWVSCERRMKILFLRNSQDLQKERAVVPVTALKVSFPTSATRFVRMGIFNLARYGVLRLRRTPPLVSFWFVRHVKNCFEGSYWCGINFLCRRYEVWRSSLPLFHHSGCVKLTILRRRGSADKSQCPHFDSCN
jgi:hypothetical protein